MLKKLLMLLPIAAIASGICSNSFAAIDRKGKSSVSIRFEGRIVDDACELSTNADGNVIHLGKYPSPNFQNYRSRLGTNDVPFELIIRRCRIFGGKSTAAYTPSDFPVERVKLTFTDNRKAMAKSVDVRVKYTGSDNQIQNVVGDKQTRDISISEMRYDARKSNGLPEYHIPLRANMVATGTGPVAQESVQGQMAVTLNYE